MTIRKKRKVLRCKDRDLRIELLLTSTIRHLCQEIGDHLRSRREQQTLKRKMDDDSTTVSKHELKRSRNFLVDENGQLEKDEEVVGPAQLSCPNPANSIGPLAIDDRDQKSEDHPNSSQLRKRKSNSEDDDVSKSTEDSKDNLNEKDPFGLDEFFRSLKSCRVGGSKR
jgi:DNA mismatch repair ATPase MutL